MTRYGDIYTLPLLIAGILQATKMLVGKKKVGDTFKYRIPKELFPLLSIAIGMILYAGFEGFSQQSLVVGGFLGLIASGGYDTLKTTGNAILRYTSEEKK